MDLWMDWSREQPSFLVRHTDQELKGWAVTQCTIKSGCFEFHGKDITFGCHGLAYQKFAIKRDWCRSSLGFANPYDSSLSKLK